MGTVAYMAPEVIKVCFLGGRQFSSKPLLNSSHNDHHRTPNPQCQNKEGHGRKADVWSLGCVVLEMLTGQRPYSDTVDMSDNSYYQQLIFMIGSDRITMCVPLKAHWRQLNSNRTFLFGSNNLTLFPSSLPKANDSGKCVMGGARLSQSLLPPAAGAPPDLL